MDTVGKDTELEAREPDRHPRPGQSGEGARSALALLIQQEQRREAQRLREESGPASDGPAS
jgi:hypothetical protein